MASLLRYANILLSTDADSAIRIYKQIAEQGVDNYVAYNNLANLLFGKGDGINACQYAQQALNLAPDNIDVLDTIGTIELSLGKINLAAKRFKVAYQNAGEDLPARIWINYIEALLKNSELALALAKRRIEQFEPSSTQVLNRVEHLKKQYL